MRSHRKEKNDHNLESKFHYLCRNTEQKVAMGLERGNYYLCSLEKNKQNFLVTYSRYVVNDSCELILSKPSTLPRLSHFQECHHKIYKTKIKYPCLPKRVAWSSERGRSNVLSTSASLLSSNNTVIFILYWKQHIPLQREDMREH